MSHGGPKMRSLSLLLVVHAIVGSPVLIQSSVCTKLITQGDKHLPTITNPATPSRVYHSLKVE